MYADIAEGILTAALDDAVLDMCSVFESRLARR